MKLKTILTVFTAAFLVVVGKSVEARETYLECNDPAGRWWAILKVDIESKLLNVDSVRTRRIFEELQFVGRAYAEAQGKSFSPKKYDPEANGKNFIIDSVSSDAISAKDFLQVERFEINRVTLRVRFFVADSLSEELSCKRLERRL